MLFTSVMFVGLAALAIAAPHPDVAIEERGLKWEPRGLEQRGRGNHKNNNKDVTIVDTTFVKIDEKSRKSDEQLTVLIQKKTVIKEDSNKLRDNIRRNHFKSKNRDVNTVIIIIKKVIDIRDSKSPNTRYMQRQISASNNKNGKDDVIIMVTEIEAITIGGSSKGHSKGGKGKAAGISTAVQADDTNTASASIPVVTIASNAPYSPSNNTLLLPSGAAAPTISGVPTAADPAAILEANQDLFVAQGSS